ncbi:4-hydroxybenzoate octaprenyltransferase [Caenispirillum salinarum]|uniref:4-hydroxybenzoate octaprenyltransferase n=1 Tax=Caenispirillum salinarum TaxID=859058 RepID=UPI00384B6DC5
MANSKLLVGDMPVDGWVDRFAPARLRPYLKLMRLDRPIGTWLLLLPCWWSIAMASPGGWPEWGLMALFGVGAIVMRGAGCTVNDLADRNFDGKVERTAARPIPSGAVTVFGALAFLGLELLIGLLVLIQLNTFTIMLGVASLALVGTYPFMKRITYWPQAWLGLTFNFGALMGWAAVQGELHPAAVVMYIAGLFWTLGYDTIYAHQDKEDDIIIGVKSAALKLGERTVPFLFLTYAVTSTLLILAGWLAGQGWPFYPLALLACGQLLWQAVDVDIHNGPDCLRKFKSNRYFGWMFLAAIIVGQATGAGPA